MKKLQIFTIATALTGLLSCLCLLGGFVALHDIYNDYASPRVLHEQAGIPPETLPNWIACSSEWLFVTIGFWPMLIFHLMALATFALHARNKGTPPQRSQIAAIPRPTEPKR